MRTHRERMLATIRGEPTDQIPWAPRMDLWYIAHRARGTLPARFEGLSIAEISDALGVACRALRADYTAPERPDDWALRGLGIDNHRDYPYRVELRDLPLDFHRDGDWYHTTIQTSAGPVATHITRQECSEKEFRFRS